MKTSIICFALTLLTFTQLHAQWDTITYFSKEIADLKTYDGKLFMGGNFTKNEGQSCYWSAYYNGSSIVKHTNMIGGSGIDMMDVFDGFLYAVGTMEYFGSMTVAMWDGSTWIDGGATNQEHRVIYGGPNDLYVANTSGLIRKKSPGGSFQTFYDFAGSGSVASIINYNNDIIIAGGFSSVDGVPANNIASWDGSNWSALDNGINGGVSCMAVFKNELYVAGSIGSAGGTSVNGIARWDGTAWADVGGGATQIGSNGLRDMVVFDDYLIVVGDFTEMGTVATHDVAAWDGSDWYSLSLDHHDFFIQSVEVYDDDIYVGGFDHNEAHLFKHPGVISVNELTHEDNLRLFPNPFSSFLYIEIRDLNTFTTDFEVYDIQGRQLRNIPQCSQNSKLLMLDFSNYSRGVYFLVIRNKSTKAIHEQHKLIVE